MNAVISAAQGKQITRGRTPLVPVQYEAACKALQACVELDDAKIFSDKADALAAWAKIYHDGKVLRQAKCLKLKAFRRMVILARELNPRRSTKGVGGRGSIPGTGYRVSLRKVGLSQGDTDAAKLLANLSEKKFESLMSNPRAPSSYRTLLRDDGSSWPMMQRGLMSVRSQMRARDPREFKGLSAVEKSNARTMVIEIMEWLDRFESMLK